LRDLAKLCFFQTDYDEIELEKTYDVISVASLLLRHQSNVTNLSILGLFQSKFLETLNKLMPINICFAGAKKPKMFVNPRASRHIAQPVNTNARHSHCGSVTN